MLCVRPFPSVISGPRGGGAIVPNLFVDSVAGDDGNDGLSAGAALQTLSAALAAAGSSPVIGLKYGSLWREEFDLSGLTAPVVMPYGTASDPLPRISGADIITGWAAVGGTTNVWQKSIAHDANGTNRLTVYEDDILLLRVADQATCDSTPGSYVKVLGSAGTPVSIKIHTTDSNNPNTNGSVYEVTVRTSVVIGPADTTITGIQTEKAISNNGSLDLVNTLNGRLSQCLALHGTKHNFGIGSGTLTDCLAVFTDEAIAEEPSNNPFIAFLNNGAGYSAYFVRCGLIGPAPSVDFYAHGNVTPLDEATAVQCWNKNGTFTGDFASNIGSFYDNTVGVPNALGDMVKVMGKLGEQATVSTMGNYGDLTQTDCCFYSAPRYGASPPNYTEVFKLRGNTTMLNGVWAGPATNPNYSNWMANGANTVSFSVNKWVFFGGVRHIDLHSGATYTGDFNVFFCTNGGSEEIVNFTAAGGYYTTLAAWQAATSQDANSVFLKVADQAGANAFWLGIADASSAGPVVGDFRINPNAWVYNAAGTKFTGTFADGTTPITDAGPQTHWDWNARASASGPPEAWPSLPDRLDEAQEYLASPADWNFYPPPGP